MKKNYQWLLAACLAAPAARAQQVLLQTNVAQDTLPPRTGPNRRYFGHLYASYGLVVGSSGAGLPLRLGFASSETQVGGRLKWRASDHLAFTTDLRYAYLRYALARLSESRDDGARLAAREIETRDGAGRLVVHVHRAAILAQYGAEGAGPRGQGAHRFQA